MGFSDPFSAGVASATGAIRVLGGAQLGNVRNVRNSVTPTAEAVAAALERHAVEAKNEARQNLKWHRQAVMRDLLAGLRPAGSQNGYRIRACGRYRSSTEDGVRVSQTAGGRIAVVGHQTCGSAWICPVCAGREGAKNSEFLSELVIAHEAAGKAAVFVTFTMPSERSDSLADAIEWVRKSRTRASQLPRARYLRSAFFTAGYVQTMEITWSARSGWHVHLHELHLLDLTIEELASYVDTYDGRLRSGTKALHEDFYKSWASAVKSVCGREPHPKWGCDVRVVSSGDACKVVAYQSPAGDVKEKPLLRDNVRANGVALELALSSNKQGRTASIGGEESKSEVLWTLIDRAGAGDALAAHLCREYASATHGRSCMTMRVGDLAERYCVTFGPDPIDTDRGAEADKIVQTCPLDDESFSEFSKSSSRIAAIGRILLTGARLQALLSHQIDDLKGMAWGDPGVVLWSLGWRPLASDARTAWDWRPGREAPLPDVDLSRGPRIDNSYENFPDMPF